MKLAGIVFLLALCGIAHASTVPVIPLPAMFNPGKGTFTVNDDVPVIVSANNAAERRAANYFVDLLARTRGIHLKVTDGYAGKNTIVFAINPSATDGPEGYELMVRPQYIAVSARDEAGLFYGGVTLWQLLTANAGNGPVSVPSVQIGDWPRMAWRGVMLDSARHFQSVADVKLLIDQMAQHKLNVLHWHLTDDQGWRIEIKRYPELTHIGAWRTPPDAGHDGEPLQYGGFYTQDQIRDVVAYAMARHITIVPEIDMPGHAQAAVASYPQIGVTGKRPPVSVDWGVNPYLYNVDDTTFRFIDNVLDEVMALFPSHYIHVGGDEAIKDQWKASPAIQVKIRALHLKDEDALQGWFIARVGTYLAAHGRRMIGWDEILDGGVPADATVMSWRGSDGGIEAAKKGHDVIMSPSPDLYLDSVQSDLPDEAAGRNPVRDLASIYAFNPVPASLIGTQAAKHFLGAQVNVWTEHMPSTQHVEHALFPRLDALSEIVWSPDAKRVWPDFLSRLSVQFGRYANQHIDYADSAFAANIQVDAIAALKSDRADVTIADQAGYGAIHYTDNGNEPDIHSPLYHGKFSVAMPATIKAKTFDDDGHALAATRTRMIDRSSLLTRLGVEMPNCPGSDFRLRVQPMPDATSMKPVYAINVFDSCEQFIDAPLDNINVVHAEVVRLERNYALAHDQKLVIARPHSTPYGELVVHLDRCDGPVLASMPLPDPAGSSRRFSLDATLPRQQGAHTLCMAFTAPIDGPIYAMDSVSLQTAGTGHSH
jgi:hexosaminidase